MYTDVLTELFRKPVADGTNGNVLVLPHCLIHISLFFGVFSFGKVKKTKTN